MKALRTPDDRFVNLPGWNHEPRYTDVAATDGSGNSLRVAHYEAGPADANETFLLMHGEPSWSYLYRHMADALVAAGHRVVMPDLVGFGRSDKPTELDDYTYERHVAWMLEWFDANNFDGLTFFGQDWGGLVGLRLVTARPERFRRIVVSNTGLPLAGREPSEAFRAWQKFSREIPEFTVGKLVSGGCASKLPPEVIAAYDAPFPDESHKAGARIFPSLYPDGDDHPSNIANKVAWAVLESWTKPFLTCFSDGDPVTAGGQRAFERAVPGASGQRHMIVEGGGHFVQEDKGPELAAILVDFVASNPAN
ncbi:MAG: haloalkane dehalogenase [Ilumatobacteraceae bacterium]